MITTRTKKFIAGILAVIAAATFVAVLTHATTYAPEENSNYAPQGAAAMQANFVASTSVPGTLSIPVLGIHTKVQQVGLTKSGAMGVPNNFTDVAWYKYGPKPGQKGSAVIDGHVDNALSLAGVFKHLKDLHPGDDIYVISQAGTATHFIVSSAQTYSYADFPNELVFNRADQPRLNLITCDGVWEQGKHMYSERLVVYATLAP